MLLSFDTLPVSELEVKKHYLHYTIDAQAGRWQLLTVMSEHRKILQRMLQDILNIQSGYLSKIVIQPEAGDLLERLRSSGDGKSEEQFRKLHGILRSLLTDWRQKDILREEEITQ